MKILKKLFILDVFFLCLSFFSIALAAPPEKNINSDFISSELKVKSIIENPIVTIGEKIVFLIKVTSAGNIEVNVPDFSEKLHTLKMEDSRHSSFAFFGKRFLTYSYILKSYKPGEYSLSGIEVQYKKTGEENWQHIIISDKPILVKSVLGNNNAEIRDIKDIKGPLSYRSFYWISLIFFIAFIVIGVLFFLLWRQHKNSQIAMLQESATARALRKIKELKNKDFISRGMVKEFYFHLSLIARQYLEDRFLLRAPEMTTEEFLLDLKDSTSLSMEHKILLREFLFNCDLVKFAKYAPTAKEIDQALIATTNLIEQTKPEETRGQEHK